ncbi:NEDD8-activating enzyme E1 regulatory subunit-like [Ornithodoros turicata]|uniref:NEDD8-activating enzyme E1 regulatory subunit-like n=1 Tax=Ornithodoros turicata TaxID=34597 RepID=UPI00313A1618
MAASMNMAAKSPESEKSKKYDRQLRLWGDHGQAALESAHVCLINATATGTEILKSIVLPGIGAFTIVDGNKVTAEDVGNNFFLDKESIGRSRAQVATNLVLELNPDVRGDFVDEMPENLMEHNPSYFSNFNVVIATGLLEKSLRRLGSLLWDAGVPLLVCRSYGMIGYMRLQINEHPVIETHPDNTFDDLRLDNPFPALRQFVDSIHMEALSNKDHSHTPYVVILLKALDEWQQQNGKRLPQNYKEKAAFKEIIKQGIRVKENLVKEDEENFEEALRAVNVSLCPTEVPAHVKELFDDPSCLNLTVDSKPFWVLVRALKDFVANEGKGTLPLRGSIPDMTADTERYVKLLNIYHTEAERHVQAMHSRVQQLLTNLGKPQDFITECDTKLFCKNAYTLHLYRGRSLDQEYDPKSARVQEILSSLDSPDSEMIFYVMLRAVDRFYSEFNRYPGYFEDQLETDISKLKASLGRILQEWGSGHIAKDDYVHEMCRYGACELHTVAAFIGGCAAQEVIKLTTGQYVPFDNTFIYNAMTTTSVTYAL